MREDTEALLLGRGASKMCLGGPLLAAKIGTTFGGITFGMTDHFWHDRLLLPLGCFHPCSLAGQHFDPITSPESLEGATN